MSETSFHKGLPVRLFANQTALERWLSVELPSSKGVWLRLAKKGSDLTTVSKVEAIDAARAKAG